MEFQSLPADVRTVYDRIFKLHKQVINIESMYLDGNHRLWYFDVFSNVPFWNQAEERFDFQVMACSQSISEYRQTRNSNFSLAGTL